MDPETTATPVDLDLTMDRGEGADEDVAVTDLIEDVSIDGMCGVY
jgi:mycofactocin precursor